MRTPIEHQVPLAAHTTLGVGGPAWGLASAKSASQVAALLAEAASLDKPVLILGGGSNLLVSDAGFPGLVITVDDAHLDVGAERVRAGAGLEWDALVRAAIAAGLSGLECLSGIPGRAGAAPMQNIGAYGQEVADTLRVVHAVDRQTGAKVELQAADCGFDYRASHFKGAWRDRYVITGIELELSRRGPAPPRYEELTRRLPDLDHEPARALEQIRREVLALRRAKSMLLDPMDPNARSAGSFFLNPVVSREDADQVERIANGRGFANMPRFDASADRVKLSAAWLIERAGFAKGWGAGPAGLSTHHTLAIVNRGGARAADILRVAREVRRGVLDVFGVTLSPEPVLVGFEGSTSDIW